MTKDRKIKEGVTQTLLEDPDTGDQAMLIVSTPSLPGGISGMLESLRRQSPPGRIADLRRHAEALPDAYPEKSAALSTLDLAEKATGERRMRRIAEAETQLTNALRRKDRVFAKRRAGGKSRAAAQGRDASMVWKPYIAMYRQHREAGASPTQARKAVRARMSKDAFTLPTTSDYPSEQTIRKWLRD